jgi:hypothetical protein
VFCHVFHETQKTSLGVVPRVGPELPVGLQGLHHARYSEFVVALRAIESPEIQTLTCRREPLHSYPMTRFTMQWWKYFFSGSSNAIWSSSFSIFLINSSASSFCDVIMYETHRFARTIGFTFNIYKTLPIICLKPSMKKPLSNSF